VSLVHRSVCIFVIICLKNNVLEYRIGVYMILRSPILGACTLAIVPIVGLINKFYGDWLGRNALKVQNALADATSCAHESLSCIKTVIMLASEDHECEKYKNQVEKLYDLLIQQLIAQGIYFMGGML
jgi:ABC-type multidrug transport system fused ATPase/permease subunit